MASPSSAAGATKCRRHRRQTPQGARAAAAAALALLVLAAPLASAASAPASASPKKPAAAAAAKAAPKKPSPVGSAARVAAAADRLGGVVPPDPGFNATELPGALAVKDWSKFTAAFPRFIGQIKPGLQRGRELARQPIPPEPTDPIVGDCVPFRPPAPYKTLQEYAKTFAAMPWQEAERLFRTGKTYEGGIGIRGCAAGVIAGNNLWGDLGRRTPLGDSWSGKCIDEDSSGVPYALTNAIAPFIVNNRDWIKQRVPGDKMGTASVALGKSWLDGQPAWVFDYSKSEMLYGFDFRDIRDEVRIVEPGFAIGQVIALATTPTHVSAFNPSNTSLQLIYFSLFQTCASDGNYPTQPIDRVYS